MDEAAAKLVGKLVIIRGQLLINGTSLTELEFPELAVIYSKNGEDFNFQGYCRRKFEKKA